jgi:hypothetical protein
LRRERASLKLEMPQKQRFSGQIGDLSKEGLSLLVKNPISWTDVSFLSHQLLCAMNLNSAQG